MRHQRSGKKLGRDSAHRKALYSNLAGALIEHGRIQTTEAKAKAVKPFAEKMITLGKRGDLHARRQALAALRSNDVVHQLFSEVAPRFADRPGGYTRIVRLGPRPGDAAAMVYLELVDHEPAASPLALSRAQREAAERRQARERRRAERRRAAARRRERARLEAAAGPVPVDQKQVLPDTVRRAAIPVGTQALLRRRKIAHTIPERADQQGERDQDGGAHQRSDAHDDGSDVVLSERETDAIEEKDDERGRRQHGEGSKERHRMPSGLCGSTLVDEGAHLR